MIHTTTLIPNNKMSDSVLEYYNGVLAMHHLVENSDYSIMIDNFSLQRIG